VEEEVPDAEVALVDPEVDEALVDVAVLDELEDVPPVPLAPPEHETARGARTIAMDRFFNAEPRWRGSIMTRSDSISENRVSRPDTA
jgi:hypothetical protein